MMIRRTFLKLIGAAIAALTLKPVATVAVVKPELPPWCPPGWVPMMGHVLTIQHHPHMFEDRGIDYGLKPGRKWVPPYARAVRATLPTCWPALPDLMRANGWQDRLTIVPHAPDTRVAVTLLAVEPKRLSHGRLVAPGFTIQFFVEQEDFEAHYGPIPTGEKISAGFVGYGYETVRFAG